MAGLKHSISLWMGFWILYHFQNCSLTENDMKIQTRGSLSIQLGHNEKMWKQMGVFYSLCLI